MTVKLPSLPFFRGVSGGPRPLSELFMYEPAAHTGEMDIWLEGFEAGLAHRDPQRIPTTLSRNAEAVLAYAIEFLFNRIGIRELEISEQELEYPAHPPKVWLSNDPRKRSIIVKLK